MTVERGSAEYLLAKALGCGESTAQSPAAYDVLSEAALQVCQELEALLGLFDDTKDDEAPIAYTLGAMAERLQVAQWFAQNLREQEGGERG